MARYYRRRRRWGRRRYLRRRFGVGGGNRKRPSSYSIAYGFTKQFDKIISDNATVFSTAPALSDIYSNYKLLAQLARVFFETNIDTPDVNSFSSLSQDNPGLVKADFTKLIKELYSGVLRNHVEEKTVIAINTAADLPIATVKSYASEKDTLLQVFKTQFKDALQKVTKRNLPFSLAVSSYVLSYLKNKKRRRKYLNFWKFKSVPRFMILLTHNLKAIWGPTKYGRYLENLLAEIDYIKMTTGTRRLLQLARAGVETAKEELSRIHTGVNNAVGKANNAYTTGFGGDVV